MNLSGFVVGIGHFAQVGEGLMSDEAGDTSPKTYHGEASPHDPSGSVRTMSDFAHDGRYM